MTPMDLALRKMSPHMSPADRMSLAEQKTSRRNMYGHQMSRSQLAERKMSMLDGSRRMSSFDDDAAQGSQYYKHTDGLGNYVYGYSYGTQEKFEEGSPETGVKGHYTFVDANGVSKRVDYVADKEGFRVLNDDSAPSNRASTTSPTRRASAFSTTTARRATASGARSAPNPSEPGCHRTWTPCPCRGTCRTSCRRLSDGRCTTA